MKNIKQKIFKVVNNNRLKLIEGKRKWYNYILNIQELFWSRNLMDGYYIHVFDRDERFLETVKIEIKIVCEFGCVHEKMFLKN